MSLKEELQDIAEAWKPDLGDWISGDKFPDDMIEAILTTISKHLPEKKYTKIIIPGVGAEATDEEYIYNQAIDEVNKLLTTNNGSDV